MTNTDFPRKLFTGPCSCNLAAAIPEQFPPPDATPPEVALAGRSNVGKSSLINALTGRSHLARSSKTPGRTQQIVFFNLADKLMLVDLPGYGHARAPKSEIAQWNGLIRHYLRHRPNLRCVALLIDSRHGLMANDLAMMDMLDKAAVSYQIVLTKADQLRGTDHDSRCDAIRAQLKKHPAAAPDLMLTSSEKNLGIAPLRAHLAAFATP